MNTNDGSIVSNEDIQSLVVSFHNDFITGCHHTTSKYHASKARKRLVELGCSALPQIAVLIKENFSNLKSARRADTNWELFSYVIWLIVEIIYKCKLLNRPYSPGVAHWEQDIGDWYDFCLKPG